MDLKSWWHLRCHSPSSSVFLPMRSCVLKIIPYILAFVSPQVVADHKTPTTNNTLSSLTKSYKTLPSRTIASQTNGEKTRLHSSHSATRSPTKSHGHKTRPNHSATRSPTKSHKTPPSHMTVSRSSEKVPTRSNRATGFQTRSRSSTAGPDPTEVKSTTHRKPKSVSSRASDPAKATTESPPAKTAANPTIPQITSEVTASKTLTIRNGQTASAQVGWLVVGVGIGGSVSVGGHILPVAGGTEAIIGENGSGQDELSTINTSTTSSSASSTSSSTSRSTSSSTSSSSSASPTPYNIYPRLGSTPSQQSAFARDLEQIAQPGSVRSITGRRLLLWVASLTPAQASEVQRNPVVSVSHNFGSCYNLLIRFEALRWIGH